MLGTEPIENINALMKLVNADFIILELPQNLDALPLRDPISGALTVGIGRNFYNRSIVDPISNQTKNLWLEMFPRDPRLMTHQSNRDQSTNLEFRPSQKLQGPMSFSLVSFGLLNLLHR